MFLTVIHEKGSAREDGAFYCELQPVENTK